MTAAAAAAAGAAVRAGVELVTAVPDSRFAPLWKALQPSRVQCVQVCDEATAVGVAAGATLAGTRALVMFESSGVRRACETISRLTMSHRLHCMMLISDRGSFGERQWWGLGHGWTLEPMLDLWRTARCTVPDVADLEDAARRGDATLDSGQCSVALLASRTFCDSLNACADLRRA